MRLFVALFPPEAALAHLTDALSKTGIKTTPPERLHITLAFLGDQPDPEPALAALDLAFAPSRPATSSSSTREQMPVPTVGELAISGGGRFGALLWAGITGDVDGLTRLTRLVRRSLRANRVRPDDKRFRPHITVARRVQPELMAAGLAALSNYDGPIWTPQELILVHSEMGPNPAYHHLRAWPLPAVA